MEQMYEGKAKKVFKTDNENEVLIMYKDDATAFNALKKGVIEDKGIFNNEITSVIFEYLSKNSVENHFIKKLSDREQLCKKVDIIPIEVITRNILAGSTAKLLGIEEGYKLASPIYELCYKNDDLGDPLINDYHAINLGFVSKEDLDKIYVMTKKINNLLKVFFDKLDIILVDFKLEFGKDHLGNVILADEISPDTCRFWDKNTNEKLDKDRFRRDLGNVKKAYEEILSRITK